MITLREALKCSKNRLEALRKELNEKARKQRQTDAYMERFLDCDLNSSGQDIPVAIKDSISVRGQELTCGNKILQGYIAPYDTTAVVNLKKNGFSSFGRANTGEFAMGSPTTTSFYGRTLDPLDFSRVPGDSGGDSATAVAANLALASLRSGTDGSVRQPAALRGCVGLKPSYGKVSRYGLAAYSSSLDQIGVLAQSVEDAVLLYDAITGHDEKDNTSADVSFKPTSDKLNASTKLKVTVIENYVNAASKEMKNTLLESIGALKAHGHGIVHRTLQDYEFDIAVYYIIAATEANANLSHYDGVHYGGRSKHCENLKGLYINIRSESFGEEAKRRILLGTFVLSSGYYDAYYIRARKARAYIKAKYEEILQDCGLIFMSVASTTAFAFDTQRSPMQSCLEDIYTTFVNLAGPGSISMPVSKGRDGLSVSAQLICRAYDEQTLLNGALSLGKIVRE